MQLITSLADEATAQCTVYALSLPMLAELRVLT